MKRSRHAALSATALAVVCVCAGAVGPASAATTADPVPGQTPPAVATDTAAVTHAQNPRVPEGASWTQHYFPSADSSGVELHADVLLPEGLAPGAQVPVVLSVGPYFGHSGQLSDEGHEFTGPSSRYDELITEGGLLDRGYALVRVDSRGFGGSTGCHDLAGPGEQADVRAAVDWAAGQPWSTGSVGMYGKSYDGITALVGNNLDQDALKAVVAKEPIWEPVTNFRSNGIPRSTITNVSQTYSALASLPQLPDDDARYQANAAWEVANPTCYIDITNGYNSSDEDGRYWTDRDLPAQAEGSDTPLFVTQGFTEWNTEAQSMQEYLDNHEGPERGWLGQWDHVSGGDRLPDGTLEMGREGWFDEVMDFYDQNLKGAAPTSDVPAFSVQDSTGVWRGQDSWPVVDREVTLDLADGSYVDDGLRSTAPTSDPAAPSTSSYVTRSEPLTEATRITGTPEVRLTTQDRGDVMVRLHDIAPDGTTIMVDEQVARLQDGETTLELRSTDWLLPVGHSLAVEVGTVQPAIDPRAEDWIPSATGEEISVTGAQLDLALDDPSDDVPTQGGRAVYQTEYLAKYTVPAPNAFSAGDASFTLPSARD